MDGGYSVIPLRGIPEVRPGDDLVGLLSEAALRSAGGLEDGDVVVVAAKIVSKAEGRFVELDSVEPTPFAYGAAKLLDKDPRVVEIILRETLRVVKMDRDKFIVENLHGVVCANAGVDLSNVGSEGKALLLPQDPDGTARALHEGFRERFGVEAAVVVTDTVGRPWRDGLVQVAIGCYGMEPLKDYRGKSDPEGFCLQATVLAQADEICSAAGLVLGKTERVPAALIRGFSYEKSQEGAKRLLRKPEDDLFR